mmetsp:Transcript_4752/g.30079  ORF Transcript_4752/g.30079 Transcript_4752/m.30079 type:complete len:153 (+) Transcript_4752:134-592(+)
MAQTRRTSVVWVDEDAKDDGKEAGGASERVVDLTVAGHTPKRRKKPEEECVIVREIKKRNRTRPPAPPLGAVEIVDPATLKRNGPAAKRRGNVAPENSRKCTVCLGEMEKMSSTTCGHVFCWDCIRRAVASQQKCPTCRKKLTAKQIHRIYL